MVPSARLLGLRSEWEVGVASMNTLQEVLEAVLREHLSPNKLSARLIEAKLRGMGVTLTAEQVDEIETTLVGGEASGALVGIGADQLSDVDPGLITDDDGAVRVDLDFSEQEIDRLVSELSQAVARAMPAVIQEVSAGLLGTLKEESAAMLRDRRSGRESFDARLQDTWSEPLDLLEMLLAIALEAGDDFNREFRSDAAEQGDFVFDALTRLHARACQVASEILVLLKSGHADGADARWRSLHEIPVVGLLIKSNGNDIAERYLLHDIVESRKAAREYQEHCSELGYEPLMESELDEIESTYQVLLCRFGGSYKETYGWAIPVVGKKRPNFADIERTVDLKHLRPFYRMASYNVHANPKGVFHKLGLYRTPEVLLAGPSNTGLADPGQGTAISLLQITTALLTSKPNLDRLAICDVMQRLVPETCESFVGTQQMLQERHSGAT